MRIHFRNALSLVVLLLGTGCATPVDLSKKGFVTTPATYSERAMSPRTALERNLIDDPVKWIRSSRIQETNGTYTVRPLFGFRKRGAGGDDMTLGLTTPLVKHGPLPDGPTSYAYIEPGHYDLTWFSFGEDVLRTEYDGARCGNISFKVGAGEKIAFRGVSPAATTRSKNPLRTLNEIHLVKFDRLPDDYARAIRSENIRLVELTSDNPTAFSRCVQEMGDGNKMVPF